MITTAERYGWATAFALLVALAVPWFMWGDSGTRLGLPLWLWWHVAWMLLAAAVFWLFASRAWGLAIVDGSPATDGDPPSTAGDDETDERRGGLQ